MLQKFTNNTKILNVNITIKLSSEKGVGHWKCVVDIKFYRLTAILAKACWKH